MKDISKQKSNLIVRYSRLQKSYKKQRYYYHRFKSQVGNIWGDDARTIVVENVVTHGDYRKKGYATACLNFAKQIAEENHCYKMMLLTGSKEESTLNFYRNAGYNSSDMQVKTGKCHSVPTVLENGKIELSEQWEWTSGDCSKGESLLVEV